MKNFHWTLILLYFFSSIQLFAQEKITYKLPPQEILDIIDAPPTPAVYIHPNGEWILILDRPNLPSIEEVAKDELRIGGLRINPLTNGQSRSYYYNNIKLLSIDEKKEFNITGLPGNAKIENISWSPDGNKIAFTNTITNGIELWILDLNTKKAVKLTEGRINDATYGSSYVWTSDSKYIIFKSIDTERLNPPEKSKTPTGPNVQVNLGKEAPVRTYQDLLKNQHDEALFKYYATSYLVTVDLSGNEKNIGNKGLIKNLNLSPDGKYILLETVKEPFSYIVPYYRFPFSVDILDVDGNIVKHLADIPLADDIPKGYGSVRKGPRYFTWRSDSNAELYWVEAQDEGDAKKESEIRDKLFVLNAPFIEEPREVISFKLRFGGVTWGNESIAITSEWWWSTRNEITSAFSPANPSNGKTILFDRSFEDRYNNPGYFETKKNKAGKYVLLSSDEGKILFLLGEGASEEGNRPFVDKFDVKSKETKRLWRSEAPYFEDPYQVIDPVNEIIITRRESIEEQPNFYLRDIKENQITQLTKFPHPYPNLININKELIRYKRKDGLDLTGTLYLPFEEDEKNKNLPVIMWAYPQEYKSSDAAGQVKDSPCRFDRIGWWSPLLWLTQGYAVFKDPSMPIVGEGDEEPNDTYLEQLVSSAEAAIQMLFEKRVADTSRIAIGGHSYGAFMTANLLAHSDLFAAGIARSGAYNRTLTPFGFQAEERTFWEAKDTYFQMSPFMFADKIKEPLLLIHGEADNNSGTFPMQSERFYNALKGHGATVRLVMLPHESHSYRARESIMHMLWETAVWLDKYVK